jgi:enoyl-CoA hydratase/carnithine racemase
VVGLGRAKELIMTARLLDAAEAERIGLVNRLAAPEELREVTDALVGELLEHSPLAVGRAKRVLDASARPALAHTLEMEIDVQEFLVASLRERMRESQERELDQERGAANGADAAASAGERVAS